MDTWHIEYIFDNDDTLSYEASVDAYSEMDALTQFFAECEMAGYDISIVTVIEVRIEEYGGYYD